MATVLELPCPQCKKPLKVPTNILGKKIKCKFCSHAFVATDPDAKPAVKASKPGGAVKAKKEEPKPEAKPAAPPAPASTYKFEDDDEGDGGAKPNPLGVVDMGEDIPRCPHCAKELDPPDAKVCVHCGFNNVTRTKAESKKVWAPTAEDYLSHLGPGIVALILFIGIIVFDIICIVNMRDWLLGTFLEKDEPGADGEKAFYVKPGAFIALIIAIDIMPAIAMANFAIKRLFINNQPPEQLKK